MIWLYLIKFHDVYRKALTEIHSRL